MLWEEGKGAPVSDHCVLQKSGNMKAVRLGGSRTVKFVEKKQMRRKGVAPKGRKGVVFKL